MTLHILYKDVVRQINRDVNDMIIKMFDVN